MSTTESGEGRTPSIPEYKQNAYTSLEAHLANIAYIDVNNPNIPPVSLKDKVGKHYPTYHRLTVRWFDYQMYGNEDPQKRAEIEKATKAAIEKGLPEDLAYQTEKRAIAAKTEWDRNKELAEQGRYPQRRSTDSITRAKSSNASRNQ